MYFLPSVTIHLFIEQIISLQTNARAFSEGWSHSQEKWEFL